MTDKVIQLDAMRLTRRDSGRIFRSTACKHMNLTSDDQGDTVTCDDCGKQVSAFWAMTMLAEFYEYEMRKLAARTRRQTEVENKTLHLKAAQRVEKVWRSRSMVPCCPHCGEGIAADDGFGGSAISKKVDEQRRIVRRTKDKA